MRRLGDDLTRAIDFFDCVRDASQDIDRCNRQLRELEQRMRSLGGGSGGGQRVRSTPGHDRMERRVASYVDRERALERRMDADYDLIGRAHVVLYGDGERRGIDSLASPVWADVLYWRYIDGSDWSRVARAVGYSVRPCQMFRDRAMSWVDENRFMSGVIDSVNL